MPISASLPKNDQGGVTLDTKKDNVADYVKDMDKRNRKLEESKARKLSNDSQAILLEHSNGLFNVASFGMPSKTAYFDYDVYMKNNTPWRKLWRKLNRKMEQLFA